MLVYQHGVEIPEELQAWIRGHIAAHDPNEPVLFQPVEPQITCNLNGEDEPDDYNAVVFEGPEALLLLDVAALIDQSEEHTGLLFVVGSEEPPMIGAINGHETEVEILE